MPNPSELTRQDVENTYPHVRIESVVDGDTLVASIALGLGITARRHVRLYGVNCPELHMPSSEAGLAAKAFTQSLLPVGACVVLVTHGTTETEKYGRVLADVLLPDGRDLGQLLVQAGHAVPYLGLSGEPT